MNSENKNKTNKQIFKFLAATWAVVGLLIFYAEFPRESQPFASTFKKIQEFEEKRPNVVTKYGDLQKALQEIKKEFSDTYNFFETGEERGRAHSASAEAGVKEPVIRATERGPELYKKTKSVTRETLIKILCELEKAPTAAVSKKAFADVPAKDALNPCLAHAQKNSWLKPLGLKKVFSRKKTLKRSETAAILKAVYNIQTDSLRSAAETKKPKKKVKNAAPQTASTGTADALPAESPDTATYPLFTPVAPKLTDANYFENVVLSRSFPNTYYKNEMYFFEGQTVASGAEKAFVFLMKDETVLSNFIADVKNGKFSIPVFFETPGNYKIGLIVGTAGRSKLMNISVLSNFGRSGVKKDDPPAAEQLSYKYEKGNTSLSWAVQGNANFVRVKFLQPNKKAEYFFRTAVNTVQPTPLDLKKLSVGRGAVVVETANGITETGAVELTSQWTQSQPLFANFAVKEFRTVRDDDISAVNFPEVMSPGTFTFKATTKKKLQNKGLYTAPDGSVKSFQIKNNGEEIAASTAITITQNFEDSGTYIFELNDPEGGAAVNVPVYVGKEILPILPDYGALHPVELDPKKNLNLEEARKELLALINKARKQAGLKSVKAEDSKLHLVAQRHSEDMSERNFFGHNNPDKQTPEDRRKALRIPMAIHENLAKAPTIEQSHEGLMRSPIHRKNILTPDWTRVGLGIAKNEEGYLLISEEFATEPLTENAVAKMKESFMAAIQEVRQKNNLPALANDGILENVASEWSRAIVNEHFFDFKKSNGESLLENARKAGSQSTLQAFIVQGGEEEKIIQELVGHPPIKNEKFVSLGMGVAGDFAVGLINITLLYAQ